MSYEPSRSDTTRRINAKRQTHHEQTEGIASWAALLALSTASSTVLEPVDHVFLLFGI